MKYFGLFIGAMLTLGLAGNTFNGDIASGVVLLFAIAAWVQYFNNAPKRKDIKNSLEATKEGIARMIPKVARAEKYILYSGDLEAMKILEIAKDDETNYFQILNGSKNQGNTTMEHVINMFTENENYTDTEISTIVNSSVVHIEAAVRMGSLNSL